MDESRPLLVDTGRGYTVSYRNRTLYGKSTPAGRAEEKAYACKLQPDTLYIVSSPLLFYGIDILLSKLPPRSYLLGLEADLQLYQLALKAGDTSILSDPRFSLHYINGISEVISKVESVGIENFRRISEIRLNGGSSLNRRVYGECISKLELHIQRFWKNRITSIHLAPLWLKNILLNLPFCWNRFSLPVTEKPVIVAGAGESLEQLIPFIKKYRKFFFLFAVDTALPVLQNLDILPDLILAVDSQFYNFLDFYGLHKKAIPLICDITCYPPVFRLFEGRIFPFVSAFADIELLKRLKTHDLLPPVAPSLGSVGLYALYWALRITSRSVIYTGIDFSYRFGKSHARGAPVHLLELIQWNRLHPGGDFQRFLNRPLLYRKNREGKDVLTDLILTSYSQTMDQHFKPGKRLFQASPSGLPGPGRIFNPEDFMAREKESPGEDFSAADDTEITTDTKTSVPAESYIRFLNHEIELLSRIYMLGVKQLQGNLSSLEKTEVSEALEKADYLVLHFPDRYGNTISDPGYLKRVLISAVHYKREIEKARFLFTAHS